MTRFARVLLALLCLAAMGAARAQLTIEIIGGGATTIPIAIVPFASESAYPLGITTVVGADLSRSGLFKLVDAGGINPRPARAEDVRYGDWTSRGADAVVVGSMATLPDGRVEVRFFLVDVVNVSFLSDDRYATDVRLHFIGLAEVKSGLATFDTPMNLLYLAKEHQG
jgi:TolB protein